MGNILVWNAYRKLLNVIYGYVNSIFKGEKLSFVKYQKLLMSDKFAYKPYLLGF